MRLPTGMHVDNPSYQLLQAHISYYGATSAAGAATGTTLVDANLANQPSYVGLAIKPLDGDAAGQVRAIQIHDLVTGTITVADPFTDNAGAVVQIAAGTNYIILSLAGGGGVGPVPGPEISLWMFGITDPGMAASTTVVTCTNLAGRFPDDIFNNEFWMQVIHNTDAPGTAPEREIRRITDFDGATGQFTVDAFSANVEAGDLLAIFHESIMGIEICGFGTLDTSDVSVPADSARPGLYGWENDDYFNGCLLMPTEGDCRFQPRRIADYTNATGVFALQTPFSQAPGLVDYVIIRDQYGSPTPLETDGTYSHPNGVAEQTAFTITPTRTQKLNSIFLDLVNLTQNADIRIKYQIDGANYRTIETFNWTVGMDDGVYFREITIAHPVQVTIQSTVAEGAARDIPYAYFLE